VRGGLCNPRCELLYAVCELDEVLRPVVQQLGGETSFVPLTSICQDQSVRQYFSMGMKCQWDFEDFAIYFHAHSETWVYNEKNRSLRLRNEQDVPEKPPAKRKKVEAPRNPTKVLVLNNLVGPGEVDSDLEEETAEEAQKHGKLAKCIVKELKGVSDEDAVRIFLEFEAVDSASKACEVFHGRIFDGRTVKEETTKHTESDRRAKVEKTKRTENARQANAEKTKQIEKDKDASYFV